MDNNANAGIKKKRLIIVLLLALVLLVFAGITITTLYMRNKEASNDPQSQVEKEETNKTPDKVRPMMNKYTVSVRNKNGSPVSGVLVAFYDKNSNMLTAPEATSAAGISIYKPQEEGEYGVGILAVPYEYVLDTTVRYFENGQKQINIILETDNNMAQIGDKQYSLNEALKIANASKTDVTVKLLKDIVLNVITINNANGKKITIDGNGHKVTALNVGVSVHIPQKKGVVELKNMTLDHKNSSAAIRTDNGITLNMTDVKILATYDQKDAYKYCIINLFGGGETNLNMTRCSIVVASTTKGDQAAAIRTGNIDTEKKVNITLKDCNIDTTGASDRAGIRVMAGTNATLKLTGTTITTKDTHAIIFDGQCKVITDNCKLTSKTEEYTAVPIRPAEASIGEAQFGMFAEALKAANASETDVTIKLCKDIKLNKQMDIKNAKSKNVTLDGAGYKVTTIKDGFAFRVSQIEGTVSFCDMNLDHIGNMVFRIGEPTDAFKSDNTLNLKFEDITIDTDTDYQWALIQFNGFQTYNADMKNVSIDWDTKKVYENGYGAVIRNGGGSNVRTVNLKMTDCLVDASGAIGRKGIELGNSKDKGTIELYNTIVKTQDGYPVYMRDYTLTKDDKTVLESAHPYYDAAPIFSSLYGVAKIGDKAYMSFKDALVAANKAGGDVTIELLQDCAFGFNNKLADDNYDLNNKDGLNLTIEGNGKTITTDGTGTKLSISESGIDVTIKNTSIVHNAADRLLQTAKGKTNDIVFDNVNIIADGGQLQTAYQFGVINFRGSGTLTLNKVAVDMDIDHENPSYNQSGVIRTGNSGDNGKVQIAMTDCTFDTTGAKNRPAISIQKTTVADINIASSTLKTNNYAPIYVDGTTALAYDDATKNSWSSEDAAVTNIYATGTDGKVAEPEAKIDGFAYISLEEALKAANASDKDETITLCKDATLSRTVYAQNVNGKNITVDGAGFTLTTASAQNAICVYQTKGTVTFKNMNIAHPNGNMIFRVGETNNDYKSDNTLTLNLENTTIDADSDYQWALISFLGFQTYNVNMTNVNIDWDTTKTYDSYGGVIRNGGGSEVRTVNLVMTDCTIDASGAIARKGIELGNSKDKGTIKLVNTEIKTQNAYPVYMKDYTLTKDDQTVLESAHPYYDAAPVYSSTYGVAKIGDKAYMTLKDALVDANKNMSGDVTITLLQDCALGFNSSNGNDEYTLDKSGLNLTIDGQGRTITTGGSGITLALNKSNLSLTIKNAKLVHNTTNRFMQVVQNNTNCNFTLENVEMIANGGTSADAYRYGLINFRGSGTMTLKNTTVDMDINNNSTNYDQSGFIRTGNSGDNNKVQIVVTDSTIDNSGAKNRPAISIQKTTIADVKLTKSTLKTNNYAPIYIDGTAALTYDNDTNSKWSCVDTNVTSIYAVSSTGVAGLAEAEVEGFAYHTLKASMTAASNSGNEVTITLQKDCTFNDSYTFNTTGQTLIIDGNGKTLTTGGTGIKLAIGQSNISVILKNMTITHTGTDRFFQVVNGKTNCGVTFDNVNMTANGGTEATAYQYGLINFRGSGTMTLNKSTIDMNINNTNPTGAGVIRIGNPNEGNTVTVNMTEAAINTVDAKNMAAILVNKGNTAAITLQKSRLNTNNKAPIFVDTNGKVNPLTKDSETTWSREDYPTAGIYNNGASVTEAAQTSMLAKLKAIFS